MIYCRHLPSLASLSIFLSFSFSSAFHFDCESENRRFQIIAQQGDPLLVDIQLHDINSGNSTNLSTGVSLLVDAPYTGEYGNRSQVPSDQYSIRILESSTGRLLDDFPIPPAPPPPPRPPLSAPSISSTVAGGPSTLSAQGPLATVPLGPDPDTELRLSKGGLAAIILSVFLVVICGVVLFLYWRRKQRLRGGLPLVSPATRAAKKQPYSTLGSESTLVVNFEANKSRTLSQCTKTGIGDEDAPLSRTDFLKRERDRINQQLEMLEGRCSSDEPDPLKEIGEDNILFQINALKDKIQALEARQRLRHSSSHHHHHHAHSHSKSPFDSPPEYDSSPQHNPHSIYGQQPLPREDKTQCFCGSCN